MSLDDIVSRFESAWNDGAPPNLDNFAPPPGQPSRRAVLKELVRVDGERRRRAGEAVRLEDYLARYPELVGILDAAELPSPWPAVPGYEILGVLGRGGMGVVYKARQVAVGRVVALKMILGGGHVDESARARFRSEAETAGRLA